jgi:glycosyltransferase involved in cell wall biosynthesis
VEERAAIVDRQPAGRRLRVAYVYRHYRRTGSIPSLYVDMVERLAKDVDVTAFCASSTREPSGDGVSFVDVEPLVRSTSRLGYSLECWTFARRAARATAARRRQFDVVHVEGYASTWADLVTVHAVRAAEVDHYFSVIEPHARVRRHLSPRIFRPQTAAVLAIERRLLGHSRPLFICPTKGVERDLVRYHSVDADTITVIPYGIDVARFSNLGDGPSRRRLETATPRGRLVLLVVASQFKRKGVDVAIDTIARARSDAELWVLGDDDPRPYVRRAATAGVADRVRFLGRRPHAELPAWYGASDVLLAPSRQDSWALPVVEAMAAGCAVIAGSYTGSSEAIEHGRSGFVVEGVGDPAEMASLVDGPLADRTVRTRIAEHARRAAEGFDSDRLYPRHLEMHYRAHEARLAGSTPKADVTAPDPPDARDRRVPVP